MRLSLHRWTLIAGLTLSLSLVIAGSAWAQTSDPNLMAGMNMASSNSDPTTVQADPSSSNLDLQVQSNPSSNGNMTSMSMDSSEMKMMDMGKGGMGGMDMMGMMGKMDMMGMNNMSNMNSQNGSMATSGNDEVIKKLTVQLIDNNAAITKMLASVPTNADGQALQSYMQPVYQMINTQNTLIQLLLSLQNNQSMNMSTNSSSGMNIGGSSGNMGGMGMM